METRIQVALRDRHLGERLRELLLRTCSLAVDCVDRADFEAPGVIVLDGEALRAQAGERIERPERLVVVTSRDEESLAQAWNAGVKSVVFASDPMPTIVLSVMAAQFHARPKVGRPLDLVRIARARA